MIGGFGQFADLVNKRKAFGKVCELKTPLQMAVIGPPSVQTRQSLIDLSGTEYFAFHSFFAPLIYAILIIFMRLVKGIGKMGIWSRIMVVFLAAGLFACGGERSSATPVETFKTYIKAIRQKDTKAMKVLLSNATLKMHEQQAKAQGVTVDEIIKRESLIGESQKAVDYKDEKIDGDKATLQFKNSFGTWETMPFIREDGVWKIDKQGYADQLMKDIDDSDKKMDDLINGTTTPTP